MDSRFDFPDGTVSTEHQILVETLNQFLSILPDDEHQKVAIRLGMELLELASVASQEEIARAAGYSERTLRFYKQRLEEEGLDGLFDHSIPGRSAITTQPAVEGAVVQAILAAIISRHTLPEDETLAHAVHAQLLEQRDPLAGQVTVSMVETIRLGWSIQRLSVLQQLQEAQASPPSEQERVCLGRTQAGGAFSLAILLVEAGWLKIAQLLPMVSSYKVSARLRGYV